MGFLLYCGGDSRKLGIENERGDWDMRKFKDHILTCPEGWRFNALLGDNFIDRFPDTFSFEFHGQAKDDL